MHPAPPDPAGIGKRRSARLRLRVRGRLTSERGTQMVELVDLSDTGARLVLSARHPLAEARVEVKEVPGQPGVYNAVAWMRPWLQMEELTASLRLVANIPKAG